MEFITGALGMAVIFLVYERLQKPKQKQQEIDEESKKKERELKEHFEALMNYDVDSAYRGRK